MNDMKVIYDLNHLREQTIEAFKQGKLCLGSDYPFSYGITVKKVRTDGQTDYVDSVLITQDGVEIEAWVDDRKMLSSEIRVKICTACQISDKLYVIYYIDDGNTDGIILNDSPEPYFDQTGLIWHGRTGIWDAWADIRELADVVKRISDMNSTVELKMSQLERK